MDAREVEAWRTSRLAQIERAGFDDSTRAAWIEGATSCADDADAHDGHRAQFDAELAEGIAELAAERAEHADRIRGLVAARAGDPTGQEWIAAIVELVESTGAAVYERWQLLEFTAGAIDADRAGDRWAGAWAGMDVIGFLEKHLGADRPQVPDLGRPVRKARRRTEAADAPPSDTGRRCAHCGGAITSRRSDARYCPATACLSAKRKAIRAAARAGAA